MELFFYKINMKNGDKFLVESECKNVSDFLKQILRCDKKEERAFVNTYKIVSKSLEPQCLNSVAIISTEISSVEFYNDNDYNFVMSI